MKALHVITALNFGGAEAMLAKLVDQHRVRATGPLPVVLSLLPLGTVGRQMADSGVPVESLNLTHLRHLPAAMLKVARIVRHHDPDLIQGWMYHGNIAAIWAAKAARADVPMLWNIRHSLQDIRTEKWTSRTVIGMGAFFSARPHATIYNSAASVTQHVANGYSAERAIVIPNGFDHRLFKPDGADEACRAILETRFGISREPIIVAVIARHHPMKDHATAIEAAGRARLMGHDLHLLMAGEGTDCLPADLKAACRRYFPPHRLSLLGDRRDVAEWLPGCDIVALASAWGEGFPNILGEAMACGIPCVATDVGDSRAIMGQAGICIAPGDPAGMAAALASLGGLGRDARRQMGRVGRRRVMNEFSLPAIAARYATLYETAIHANEPAPSGREMPRCAG